MDIRNVYNDVENVKQEQQGMKANIKKLQEKELLQDEKIKRIEQSMKEIKEDREWLQRAITNAVIVSVIGGVLAVFFAAMSNV